LRNCLAIDDNLPYNWKAGLRGTTIEFAVKSMDTGAPLTISCENGMKTPIVTYFYGTQ